MAGSGASAALLLAVLCLAGRCATAAAASHGHAVAVEDWRREPSLYLMKDRLSTSAGTLGRRMLGANAAQQFFSLNPQCSWSDNACFPMFSNWFLHKGMPSSPYRRSILMASERRFYCFKNHKTQAECSKDLQNRCYWYTADGKGQCLGIDMYDMNYYEDSNFTTSLSTIPAAMACPGTKAHEMLTCYAGVYSGTCKYMPNCYMGTVDNSKVCLPTFVKSYSSDQFFQLLDAVAAVDPKVFGNCAGACWVRQAKKCRDLGSNKSACEKLPYCVNDTERKACAHHIFEFEDNEYEQTVERLYGMCYAAENKDDCEAPSKGKVTLETAIVWKDYKPPSEAAQCKL